MSEEMLYSDKLNEASVLEQGMTWQQVGIAPEDAAFLGTWEFQAKDIAARWFGVPSHMVGRPRSRKAAADE